MWRTKFFVILDHFLHFYSTNNLKNQNFGTMKKSPGDIIALHMCTINENNIMYGSWDMECVTEFFFIFGLFFPIYLPNSPKKSKFRKNEKKHMEISSFYNSIPKIMIICYTIPEIWCMTDVIIFHFEPSFALLPP